MTYIVVKIPPEYHQMSLEEFLFGTPVVQPRRNRDVTATRTYVVKNAEKYHGLINLDEILFKLNEFNAQTEVLRNAERKSLYREFHIPKKSGGLRKIDAPNAELMTALRNLKSIFETECCGDRIALYHTSAYAYIRKRSTIDAVKKHQKNESRWFAKFDLSNFFGSTTPEFVMKMFSMVFPFSEVIKAEGGYDALRTAIDLAFLDGGLPQGTPISPLITNIMMIPIDYILANGFRKFKFVSHSEKEKENYCVYTRYADDFLVSSKFDFDFKQAQDWIINTLAVFDAPFTIKETKTRYGSNAGSNWNLGVMLTQNNKITIGHKKEKQFKSMLNSYAKDKINGIRWDVNDVQVLEGYRNYYRMVEREEIDRLVQFVGNKVGVDIVAEIKNDLRTA